MNTTEDREFREEARTWLAEQLDGEFSDAVGLGGSGRGDDEVARRREWERRLGARGWIGIG